MYETIKNEMVKGELLAASGPKTKPDEAADHLSNAFKHLISEFRNVMYHGWPPAFLQPGEADEVHFPALDQASRDLLRSMREVQTVTAMGLNFKKYYKFKTICGIPGFGAPNNTGDGVALRNPETIDFCVQFVIECAERLSEFPNYISGDFWEHAEHQPPQIPNDEFRSN